MFVPNTTCDLYVRGEQINNFGKFEFAAKKVVRCAVVSLDIKTVKSSVRADTSGSRGQAEQPEGDARLLFPKTSTIKVGDAVYKDGYWLEVIGVQPRHHVSGPVDHIQVEFRYRQAV